MVRTLQGNQTFISPEVRFLSPLSNANSRSIVVNPGIYTEDGIISRINFIDSGGTNNSIIAAKNQFVFNGAPITVSSIGNSLSNLCQLPNKSGTIALTSDVELRHFYFTIDIITTVNGARGSVGGDYYLNGEQKNKLTVMCGIQQGYTQMNTPANFVTRLTDLVDILTGGYSTPDDQKRVPGFGAITSLNEVLNVIGFTLSDAIMSLKDGNITYMRFQSAYSGGILLSRLDKVL